MKKTFLLFLSSLFFAAPLFSKTTRREKQCENNEVIVWKAIIEPHQTLPMHRHDHRRVVVALTDVDLLIKNDRDQSRHLTMKRGTACILAPDRPKELHCDINNSNHPMKVMVIEWKK